MSSGMNAKFQKEMAHRLHQQKDEYEATISRHQAFIDQVTKDRSTIFITLINNKSLINVFS